MTQPDVLADPELKAAVQRAIGLEINHTSVWRDPVKSATEGAAISAAWDEADAILEQTANDG